MGKACLKTALLGRLAGAKTISCTWTTRTIPCKGPRKVSKQIIAFLSLAKIENTEFTLVEKGLGTWEVSPMIILVARNQI